MEKLNNEKVSSDWTSWPRGKHVHGLPRVLCAWTSDGECKKDQGFSVSSARNVEKFRLFKIETSTHVLFSSSNDIWDWELPDYRQQI